YQGRLYSALIPIWNASPTYCTSCGWYQDLGTCGTGGGNQPPTATLTAPTNNTTYNTGATITVSANAADSDGTVTQVQFFRGTTSLGVHTSVPYSVTWSHANAGSYVLKAGATDNNGATGTSALANITVNNVQHPDTTAHSVPTGLASPGKTSASVTLSWNAS